MTYSKSSLGMVMACSLLAAACAGTGGPGPAAPLGASAAIPTSITLQELEPGVCRPVMFEAGNNDFTGQGYINPPNTLAARVNWSIRSPNGGLHRISIRYANGTALARPGRVSLSDSTAAPQDLPLAPTGAWRQWEEASFDVDLKPGINSLVLRATTDRGLPNIDSLTVTGEDPSPGDCGNPAPSRMPSSVTDLSHLSAAPVGWVTENGGVTGGGVGPAVTVRSMEDLLAQAAGTEPRVIHVTGKLRGTLAVGSNKTIIGLSEAEIIGTGQALHLVGSRNVIIRNLTLTGTRQRHQPNTILHDVENVWLDHNAFVDGSPDLLLVSGTSNFVTLSWNLFRFSLFAHEHAGVNIGASDSATESAGRLKVTLHHNYFADLVNERMPRVRFGQVHTFNNLADAGTDELTRSYYAVRPGFEANIRSERNIYANFQGPSWYWTSERLGAETSTVFNFARGNANSLIQSIEDVCVPGCVTGPIAINEHEGVTGVGGFYSNGQAFIPPYRYTAEPTEGLAARIRAGAGPR